MQMEILQVSVQTITVTFASCTVDHNEKSNDTGCDTLNEQSCHTDVIKEQYKSNKNKAEKSKDGSGSICNHVDSSELALFPYTDALNEAVFHTDVKKELYKSNKIIAEKRNEDGSDSICSFVDSGKLALVPYKEIERGNDIAHKQNFDTSKAIVKIDLKDEKYIKRQEKKNRQELLRGNCILHEANFDTNQTTDNIDQKDKKSIRRPNKRNSRERVTPVVDLQPGDKKKDNQNLDKSQVKDVIHLGGTPKSTKIYSRKMCSSAPNSDCKWFKFACLFAVLFSARVYCINENPGINIQFPVNPIIFGTDVVLSCYRPFSENISNVSYFAWINRLTADYLANGNRSMNVSKYVPAVKHTESGINYTFRINSFDHDDFNMLYECNFGFLKGLVNLSACYTTFIYLPKNEDITTHIVRKGDQETMVIEIKRVHPNPVCTLFIKNKMIPDSLYNATVGTVLIYYSLRFEFPRDNLVQYCYHVLEITCSVGGEQIHHNQTINFSSCRENAKKSDNHVAVAVIVTVTVFISVLLATFCIVIVYRNRKRLGQLRKNRNGSGGKWDKESDTSTLKSATCTLESLIIHEDDNG